MKTLPHHPPLRATESNHFPHWHGSSADPRSSVERRWIPPAIPHRRYPSLAEDFERLGPPKRPTYRRVATVFTAASLAPNDRVHPSIRVFAVLAITAIIAALAFLR